MIYSGGDMEERAVLLTASRMCAAARTAPKGKGIDNIHTLVLTGEDKDALANKMHEVATREFGEAPHFFHRDAENVKKAHAVVLIGIKRVRSGLNYCSLCGFANCAACKEAGALCVINGIDLGIALGSAAAMAADDRVDNRVMFSIGKVAEEMHYADADIIWHGLPLSIAGKNPFFDRKQ